MFRLMRSLLFLAAAALPLLLAGRAAADPFAAPWAVSYTHLSCSGCANWGWKS